MLTRGSKFIWDEPEFTKGGRTKFLCNINQNQHWTVAFLNLTNIKMLLRKVCAQWNKSHRFPGVSHLQELHCKTLGWVSVVQQCKFLTDHLSYIQLVYILLTDSQENTFYHNFHFLRIASTWTTIATFIFSKSLSLYTL